MRFNQLCASSNPNNGDCLTCYPGYVLINNNCTIGTTVSVANCRTVVNNQCQVCSTGFYRATNNTCQAISNLCSTSDPNTGACLSCYPGYALSNGACSINVGISNCRQQGNGQCLQCSSGYFPKNGQCNLISNLCQTADQTNGNCLSCYPGYSLQNGACEIGRINSNCRRVQNGGCVECAGGYTMVNGNCMVQNPLCRTVDSSANCATCYSGYTLSNGNCIIPTNSDPNCVQKSGTICLYCQNGFWISNNVCTRLTKSCQSYDQQTGSCTSCAFTSRLIDGNCVSSPISSDVNCVSADNSGQCLTCVTNYYPKNGVCTLVNSLCVDFNYNQRVCAACQDGYFLQDGDCIYPSMGFDANCVRYSGSYCSTCKPNFFLKDYICSSVDSNCIDFDRNSGLCRACRSGNPVGSGCV